MSERESAAERESQLVDRMNVFTLPNLLSLSRLLSLIPVLYFLHKPDPGSDVIAIVILLVAGLTDLLDGFVARWTDAISPLGKVFDPIADKVLIVGLMIYLGIERGFPLWLLAAVIIRDVCLVVGAWYLFRRDRVVFGANWSGKWSTFTMGLLILAYLLRLEPLYLPLTAVAAVFVAISYFSYTRRGLAFRLSRSTGER